MISLESQCVHWELMVGLFISSCQKSQEIVAIKYLQAKMAENADAFIALPGGYGTLEELLEMITWQQLGFHTKPVGLLNVNGYFNHFISFVDHMVKEVYYPCCNLKPQLLWPICSQEQAAINVTVLPKTQRPIPSLNFQCISSCFLHGIFCLNQDHDLICLVTSINSSNTLIWGLSSLLKNSIFRSKFAEHVRAWTWSCLIKEIWGWKICKTKPESKASQQARKTISEKIK